MLRHKKVQVVLGKGLASEWNDDHIINFATRIDWVEDFMINALADNWDTADETSGTATDISFDSGFVAVRLEATGGVGNISTIARNVLAAQANFTNDDAQPLVEFAIDVDAPTADAATHEFGLFDEATAPFTANQDGCFFRIDNNVLWAVSSDGAAETKTNLGAPGQFAVYAVKHTAVADFFYVDDLETAKATHAANISSSDLTIKLTCAQRAGGSNKLNCQAVCFSGLRQTS